MPFANVLSFPLGGDDVTTINVSNNQYPRMQPRSLARNGRPVSTIVEEQTRRLANQILAFEGKELFSSLGILPAVSSTGTGASYRTRWAFRAKISPYVTRVAVMMRMAQQDANASGGGGPAPTDASVSFEMFDAASSSIGVLEHHYGGTLTTLKPSDTPDTWAVVFGYIDVTPGSEVSGLFTELRQGRLISALVYEIGPALDTTNGYLAMAPPQGANIYADDRTRLTEIVNETWLGGGSHVANINCNEDGSAFTSVGSTPKNIIDATSTAISASTPGIFFDGTGKKLDGAGGVSVVMWAFGSTTDEAYVDLKDSTGAIVGNVTFTGGTAGWHSSGAFTLPASSAKYDLHAYSTTGETITLYAVSIYEDG